jgi:predicted phage tail component-like protein
MSDWGGFKLIDGVTEHTAKELGMIMREGEADPVLPPINERTMEIPGRNGAYYFGASFGARRITIPCAFVYSETETELQDDIRALAAILIDNNSKPKALRLVFESRPTHYYDVYVTGTTTLTRRVYDGEFDLMFVAPDPFEKALST